MESIEQAINAQFARVFASSDWVLFKKVAESHLREATMLRKTDMPIEVGLRLLARNSRKRLLIGVGVELLLKAVYLKHGYAINKTSKRRAMKFPFLARDAAAVQLEADQTFSLNDLIGNLSKIVLLSDKASTLKGLRLQGSFATKRVTELQAHTRLIR